MQEHPAFPYLREILLFLALAGILIPTLTRLRINQVLGFLAAGALLGPFGLGLFAGQLPWLSYLTFPRAEGVVALAELGVMFLMFMIGLELSAARLWSLRRWVFGAGTAQVCVSALLIGGLAWLAFGRIDSAVILGFVLSLSSTAVIMQLMAAQKSSASPLGQAVFSILMLQDLAVVPLLILVGAMGQGAQGSIVMLVAVAMAKAAVAIALIYLAGGRIVHPLFRAFANHRQPDVFMALILLTTLGIAGLSAAAGLSMALGALIAGVLLAETEFKHEVELMIEPFKGLLMGLFFMTVGMNMDLRQVAAAPLWLATAVFGLIAVKALVVALLLRAGGLSWVRAVEGGLLLGQGGEFAFIVIGYATAGKLVEPALGQLIMLAVGLSLFVTPPLARLGRAIGQRGEARADLAAAHAIVQLESAREHIIIAGFGRVGRQLAKLLTQQGMTFVAFETDARLVASLRAEGFPVYFGDASRAELLHRVDAGGAPAIILTMDHAAAAMHAVRGIRREFPSVPIYARSRDEKHARALKLAGATIVVPETLEASLQLSAFVLEAMGLDLAHVDRIIDVERDQFLATLADGPPAAR
ncbi:MAG: cation:proton antiporter [Pseudomonadota bacterium]